VAIALATTTQIAGEAAGEILKLGKPISFWGGVDPRTGRISDPRHPNHDADIAGKILVLPGMIGSSSSSYIMLELMSIRRAPAALILAEPDAILGLGVVLVLPRADHEALRTGQKARIGADGKIEVLG
jgi:predicted aconitase with swiveling domain